MIRLEHINKTYATRKTATVHALQDIHLTIARGEIFGIIGKSGAGKSTLIRCVNLLERPDSGRVIVNGLSLTDLAPFALRQARRQMGMIFQHFNLLASRNVYTNIALPLEFAGMSSRAIRPRVERLLELTGLADKRHAYPANLSGGQKQRVAIARALAAEPAVLLSDEATSALDPETTQTILALLKNIRDQLGVTILLITHEMSVVKACCDRVGILQQGKLIEQNSVGAFFAHPQTATAKKFIAAALPQTLPAMLQSALQAEAQAASHLVLRLWFFGEAATQPLVAQLMQHFQLRVNILLANMEYVQHHAMGVLTLAIEGAADQRIAAMAHLQQLGVRVEVLGFVPDNLIHF